MAYFDDVVDGKKTAVKLTADEYEQGINEFDVGIRKIIEDTDEMIFRAKLGDENPNNSELLGFLVLYRVEFVCRSESS